jgi:chitinase
MLMGKLHTDHIFAPNRTGEGNKYFNCKFSENGQVWEGKCPVPEGKIVRGEGFWTLTYTLTDSKGFFDALMAKYGINETWVRFGDHDDGITCTGLPPGTDCEPWRWNYHGKPLSKGDSAIEVLDPKTMVDTAMSKIDELKASMEAARLEIMAGIWDGGNEDLSQVFSMPIFMLDQAVDSMKQVKEIGEKVEEEEKRDLIIKIISIILMVVPFVGEIGAALAGAAAIGRVIALVAVAGEAALTAYDIVKDPTSAPIAILGLLLGGGIRSPGKFKEAADARRLLSSTGNAGKVGAIVKRHDDIFQRCINACVR